MALIPFAGTALAEYLARGAKLEGIQLGPGASAMSCAANLPVDGGPRGGARVRTSRMGGPKTEVRSNPC